jgi:hypothetical protein
MASSHSKKDSNNEKEYFVCMFKQTKENPKKSEAKIYVTKCPMILLNHLNNNQTTRGISLIESTNRSSKEEPTQDVSPNNNNVSKTKKEFQLSKKKKGTTFTTSPSINSNFVNSKWEIELIVGHFTRKNALIYHEQWSTQSRGLESRRIRGLEIFRESVVKDSQLICYDKCIIPVSPNLEEWLKLVHLEEMSLPDIYVRQLYNILDDIVWGDESHESSEKDKDETLSHSKKNTKSESLSQSVYHHILHERHDDVFQNLTSTSDNESEEDSELSLDLEPPPFPKHSKKSKSKKKKKKKKKHPMPKDTPVVHALNPTLEWPYTNGNVIKIKIPISVLQKKN